MYVTDLNGTAPKLILADAGSRAGASPDGESVIAFHNGKRLIQSTAGKETREIPGIPATQFPIAWGSDAQRVFTQELNATGASLYRIDLGTGRSELWQTIKPKDQVGLGAMKNPVSITPDGRWMVYAYGNHSGQLFVSDSLK